MIDMRRSTLRYCALRAGARGGALLGNLRWARILVITDGSSMAAMISCCRHSGDSFSSEFNYVSEVDAEMTIIGFELVVPHGDSVFGSASASTVTRMLHLQG